MSVNQKFLVTAIGSALWGGVLGLAGLTLLPGLIASALGGAFIASGVILAFPDAEPVKYVEKGTDA